MELNKEKIKLENSKLHQLSLNPKENKTKIYDKLSTDYVKRFTNLDLIVETGILCFKKCLSILHKFLN